MELTFGSENGNNDYSKKTNKFAQFMNDFEGQSPPVQTASKPQDILLSRPSPKQNFPITPSFDKGQLATVRNNFARFMENQDFQAKSPKKVSFSFDSETSPRVQNVSPLEQSVF